MNRLELHEIPMVGLFPLSFHCEKWPPVFQQLVLLTRYRYLRWFTAANWAKRWNLFLNYATAMPCFT